MGIDAKRLFEQLGKLLCWLLFRLVVPSVAGPLMQRSGPARSVFPGCPGGIPPDAVPDVEKSAAAVLIRRC